MREIIKDLDKIFYLWKKLKYTNEYGIGYCIKCNKKFTFDSCNIEMFYEVNDNNLLRWYDANNNLICVECVFEQKNKDYVENLYYYYKPKEVEYLLNHKTEVMLSKEEICNRIINYCYECEELIKKKRIHDLQIYKNMINNLRKKYIDMIKKILEKKKKIHYF